MIDKLTKDQLEVIRKRSEKATEGVANREAITKRIK